MYTQSKINYGDLNLTITQSGTTTISAQGLKNIFTDENNSFEEIPCKFVQASGGLSSQGTTSWTGGTVSVNNNVLGSDPYSYYGPSYPEHLIGIDCGTAKYADSFILSINDGCAFLTSASTANSPATLFVIFGSNNNSTWTNLGTISNSSYLTHGCMYGSFTRGSYRYFVILRQNSAIQPPGTSHVNDQVPIRTNGVWFFDSQNTDSYEMLVDLGRYVKVDELVIEQDNAKRAMAFPLSVSYSLDGINYNVSAHSYHAGFYPEPDPAEASPAGETTGTSDATYLGRFMVYSKFDNSLYVYLENKFAIFNLSTRTWALSPTAILSSNQASGTIDTVENTIYGVSSGGVFWKYVIESQEFTYLSPPPVNFLGTGSSICYSSTDRALFCLVGNQVTTFYQYDIATDSWTQKANFPVSGTGGLRTGACSIWSPYDNCVYATYGQENPSIAKYNCATNTWSTTLSIPYANSAVSGNYNLSNVGIALDTKRNHLYLLGSGVRGGNCFYAIESSSWIGIPSYGISSTPGMWTQLSARNNRGVDTRRNFAGHCGVAYVPTEDRLYVHGDTLPDVYISGSTSRQFANVLRKTGPLEEAKHVKYFIGKTIRYLKIRPSSDARSSLIRIKKMKITTYDQEEDIIDIGTPAIGVAGEPKDFVVENPLLVKSSSGRAFIRPDGTQGSRYYEVCATISGTYQSHCEHNDLENFQCLASNANYDTTSCSRKCTTENGGGSATNGFSPNLVDLTFSPELNPGETIQLFVREHLPSSKREIRRDFNVVVEFDGEE